MRGVGRFRAPVGDRCVPCLPAGARSRTPYTSGMGRCCCSECAWLQREGAAEASGHLMMRGCGCLRTNHGRCWPRFHRDSAPWWSSCYYEDLTERDTAQVMGVCVAAVKSLVACGGATLRERTRGHDQVNDVIGERPQLFRDKALDGAGFPGTVGRRGSGEDAVVRSGLLLWLLWSSLPWPRGPVAYIARPRRRVGCPGPPRNGSCPMVPPRSKIG